MVAGHSVAAQGGLGLASAVRVRTGAHWASWADCLRMVRQRHLIVADTMNEGLGTSVEPCFPRRQKLCPLPDPEAGFVVPSWTSLAESEEVVFASEAEPHEPKTGWQQKATQKLHEKFHTGVSLAKAHGRREGHDAIQLQS